MGTIDYCGTKTGPFLSPSEGCRTEDCKPVYIPYKRGPHTCWSQSSWQTSARSFMILFPSCADDETECYLSFLTDFKNWYVKSTTALDPAENSQSRYICVFTEDWRKHACSVFLFDKLAWQSGEKAIHKPFHIFLNIVLQDGPGNKWLAANWFLFIT